MTELGETAVTVLVVDIEDIGVVCIRPLAILDC